MTPNVAGCIQDFIHVDVESIRNMVREIIDMMRMYENMNIR